MKKIIKNWDLGNHLVLMINTGAKEEKDLAFEETAGMKAFLLEGKFHLFDGSGERVYRCNEGFGEDLFRAISFLFLRQGMQKSITDMVQKK